MLHMTTKAPQVNYVPRPTYDNVKSQLLPDTQAARVFAKFGGVPSLYKALTDMGAGHERNVSVIYRWNLTRANGGTDGLIPLKALKSVLLAARREGIVLTADDLYPLKG